MLDFADLGKYRENNRIEAKKALGGLPKSIWETYSAFANTIGGIILLGVEEQKGGYFALAGLRDAQSLREEFWQKVNDKQIVSRNILAPADVYVRVEPEGEMVVIQVPRAQAADKPIYIGRDIYNGSYCRNGEGDFRCSRDEVRLMLDKRSEVMPDDRLIKQCTLGDLSAETIEFYRAKLAKRRPVWAALPTEELLRKIGAADIDDEGRLYPTAAGLLMFGRNKAIKSEFPEFFLDYRCYRETNRLSERLTSSDGERCGNVCDFYFAVCAAVLKNLKHSKREMIYPVLQEGLANALIHANYYAKRGLLVEQEEDLITIANPGGMRLSLKEAKTGVGSDLRNQNLSNMFKYIGIAKQKGHGIAYIYETWQNLGFDAPRLSDDHRRTVLSLCLREDDDIDRIERRKNMLIAYLTDNIAITRRQAAEYLHISPQTAAKYLHQLTDEQIVQVSREQGEKVYRLKT